MKVKEKKKASRNNMNRNNNGCRDAQKALDPRTREITFSSHWRRRKETREREREREADKEVDARVNEEMRKYERRASDRALRRETMLLERNASTRNTSERHATVKRREPQHLVSWQCYVTFPSCYRCNAQAGLDIYIGQEGRT